MRRIATILLVLTSLCHAGCDDSGPANAAAPQNTSDQTAGGLLPAGTYQGIVYITTTTLTSQWVYNPITQSGSVQPRVTPTIVPSPFAGGDLQLDGRGGYTLPLWRDKKKSGIYEFDAKAGIVSFADGPLSGLKGQLRLSKDGSANIVVSIPPFADSNAATTQPAEPMVVTFSNNQSNPAAEKNNPQTQPSN